MSAYRAPINDIRHSLATSGRLEELREIFSEIDLGDDLVAAIFEEAGRLAGEVLAPLNHSGDMQGPSLDNGVVRTPSGFREAYGEFVAGGWNGVAFESQWGGQAMPWTLTMALVELWNSANLSFATCPLLTQGAVDLLQVHGTAEQKSTYLPPLVEGRWTGTMNLTEPQAGSDVGALKTRALPKGDHYLIQGQKIFITYGEHDLAENIVHLVLARTPDAPAGSRGVSLFLVPKFLPDAEGKPGKRNDLRCVSLERKLGIKATPTTVMSYGDDGGAIGYLVGKENRGLECMFTMMNNARLAVAVQGLAIAERAYQQAHAYALDRTQGRALDRPQDPAVKIVEHPDIRRMLGSMRARIQAMRALVLHATAALDIAHGHPDAETRARADRRVGFLTPVAKAWLTDGAVEIASEALQIHGGAGFIEETGIAQHYRDARILPIYEGTNGIQALDLLGRKLLRDKGQAAEELLAEISEDLAELAGAGSRPAAWAKRLESALEDVEDATRHLSARGPQAINEAAAGAAPYLQQLGLLVGGWLLAKGAGESPVYGALADVYCSTVLPATAGLGIAVVEGSASITALADADLESA